MQQVDTIVHASKIIPIEPFDTVLDKHSVVINTDKIVDVLPTEEVKQYYHSQQEINLSEHVLLPGFVNAHTHVAMSLLRGLGSDTSLKTWLEDYIWPAEKKYVDPSFVRLGSELAIAEMLQSGTTCFNDNYFFIAETAEAALAAGIRARIGITLLDFPNQWASNFTDYLHKGLAVYNDYQSEALLSFSYAPHSVYALNKSLLLQFKQQFDRLPLPIHMHVQETTLEVEQMRERDGVAPIELLADLGLLSNFMQCVHATAITPAEIDLLAKHHAHVVHCPASNMKLASGICPVTTLLAAGINVAIGTDGAASNDSIDMLKEIRLASLLAKVSALDAAVLPAHQVLRMATLGGAKALHLDAEIGSLVAGKAADMIAIQLNDINMLPCHQPHVALVNAASASNVTDVWINGKRVLRQRELQTVDVAQLQQEVAELAKNIQVG